MAEETQGTILIDSTTEKREGVHANLVMTVSKGGTTRIDFIQTDWETESSDTTTAVLVSRVFMDNGDLLTLRDMLNRHTANWKLAEEAADDAE